MRVALLADVHANLPALDRVLRAAAGADRWVCAGDAVGYGAQPDACIARLVDAGAACVAGNHDLMAIGRLSDERCIPLARETLRWTRRVLDPPSVLWLTALPARAHPAPGVLVAHGGLDDPERRVRTPADALAELRAAGRRLPAAEVLVVGHTHRPMAVGERSGPLVPGRDGVVRLPAGERVLLNPGSVGQSRERRALARYVLLDLERRRATFHALPYDVAAARDALRRAGLPAQACHLRPRPVRAAAGRAVAAVRRAGAR